MLNQTKNIIEKIGIIEKIPENKRGILVPKLADMLEKRMIATLIIKLPEENTKELQTKLDNNDPDITQFLQSKIPDCDEILKREIDKFKAETEQILI